MEILVVISIIAILTAVGFVMYNGIKHQAYDAKVDVTLDQVENALRIYTRSLNKKIPMIIIFFVVKGNFNKFK